MINKRGSVGCFRLFFVSKEKRSQMDKIHFSDRVNQFQPGIFAVLNEKKEELIRQGKKVYNLSVGTPDFAPAPHVMEAM